MESWLLDLVSRFGYVVVFLGVGVESLGVPVPGETTLLVGVVLAVTGHLSIFGVAVAGFLGAVIGDNTGYWIGRKWGRKLATLPLIRRVYTEKNLHCADKFFDRWGWWAVFFGRFVAILRILAGPLSGMHKMHWPRFASANALGAALWVAAVTVVGLLIGDNLDHAVHVLRDSGYVGLGAAILLIVGLYVWQRRKHHE